MPENFEVSFCAVIRGFQVYQAIWTSTVGEELITEWEHGNPADAYAVAVRKSRTMLGASLERFRRPTGILLVTMGRLVAK